MTKPISPSEALSRAGEFIPKEVFSVFNELIIKNMEKTRHGIQATIEQEDVMNLIIEKMALERRNQIEMSWLNIEQAYGNLGWEVHYEKPGFNESGVARFHFKSLNKTDDR